MTPTPVPREPALLLGSRGSPKTLVIADIHLGLEAQLHRAGLHLPSQTISKTMHILKLIEVTLAKRLVILGDLKNTISGISYQERDEIPVFFKTLLSKVGSLDLVLGNHDGSLKELAPDKVSFQNDLVIGRVGLTHGHSWPSEKVMGCETVVLGHNHPSIIFKDELGQRNFHACWIRTTVDVQALGDRYENVNDGASGIIMPAFDDLGRGTPFNLKGVKLLGPLLSHGVLRHLTAEVHLLDGTYLGEVKDMMVEDTPILKEQSAAGADPDLKNGEVRGGNPE